MRARRTTVVADVSQFPFNAMRRQLITPLMRVTVLLRAPEFWDECTKADLEASEELADICFDLWVEAGQ